MPKIKKRETTAWIKAVVASYKRRLGDIGYMFVDDEKILEVNREYLGHDYYTDVITFDYDEDDVVSGDIVISLDTVPPRIGCTFGGTPQSSIAFNTMSMTCMFGSIFSFML